MYILHSKYKKFKVFNCFKALVEDLDKDTLWNVMAAIMDTYNLESTTN